MSKNSGIENENYIGPAKVDVSTNNQGDRGVIPPQGYPSPAPKPIVIQPNNSAAGEENAGWANIPLTVRGQSLYPPALEYLKNLTKLTIDQQNVSICERDNRLFLVKNVIGDSVFVATDNSSACARACYGRNQYAVNVKILDIYGTELINIHRSYSNGCVSNTVQVYSSPNELIGIIDEQCSLFNDIFFVKSPLNENLVKLEAPKLSFCGNEKYRILSCSDGFTQIGQITKRWMGFSRKCLTTTNNYEIDFSRNLDVKLKILLLASVFALF